jgi:hypothetical protein
VLKTNFTPIMALGRGSRVSYDATFRLLGKDSGHRAYRYHDIRSDPILYVNRKEFPTREWTDACDLIMGYLHSNIPNGSQTSTSMALALVSDFISYKRSEQPKIETQIDKLCASSNLLAFTAMTIAVKIEVHWSFICYETFFFVSDEFVN